MEHGETEEAVQRASLQTLIRLASVPSLSILLLGGLCLVPAVCVSALPDDFRSHLDLRRTDVERIEYLVGKGRKQLAMLSMAGVKTVRFTQVK